MKAQDLPLLELFTRLQEEGLPLGLNEYAQAVKALQAGFGLPDKEALSRLCCTLWIKNEEEFRIFSYHFANVFGDDSLSHVDIMRANIQSSTPHLEVDRLRRYILKSIQSRAIVIFIALALFIGILTGLNQIFKGSELSPLTDDSESTENTLLFVVVGTSALLTALAVLMCLDEVIPQALIRQLIRSERISPIEETENQNISYHANITSTEIFEVQLVKPLWKVIEKNGINSRGIVFKDGYFPLTRRQMQQGWRYLRRKNREGPKTELNIEGTIEQIGGQGWFTEPVMQSPQHNSIDLILLIDQDGSMRPFQPLIERLVDSAMRACHLGDYGIYYFHNCPIHYLYRDSLMQQPETVGSFLSTRSSSKSSVMIVSDAGSARGGYNPVRVQKTKNFLTQLKQYVRYVAWLNPLPYDRWDHSTAGKIADFVAMFEINRTGFRGAVDVLRGR